MAIGNIDFLSKTKQGAMGGAAGAQQAGNNKNVSSVFAQQQGGKANKAEEPNMADMSTSDLIKHVYQNNGDVNIQDKTNGNEKDMKLPITVEYGNDKFGASGKKPDEVIDEICKKTGDSKTKVESELKRKYGNPQMGASLNMQA